MNVLDATIKLYDWFGKHDSFTMEKDFKPLVLLTESPERDRAAVLCALESLEKYEVVQSVEIETKNLIKKRIWTLTRPLESMPQNVEVNYDMANMMATVINQFGEAIGRKENFCDPSQITAENVKDLIFITNFYLNGGPENEEKD